MLFSSMTFLWIFLPIVIIVNSFFTIVIFKSQTSRMRVKNGFLLSASLIFYAYGGVAYLGIMLFVILINYCGGFMVSRERHKDKVRKAALVCIVILNFGILFFFKYFNMFIDVIENIIEAVNGTPFKEAWRNIINLNGTGSLGIVEIALPVGISFYIFQAISYVVDVYRDKAPLQANLASFALYVSFFPQLIAGPIVQYSDVALQINERKENTVMFSTGIKRFCYGLGKKVILANTLAEVADGIWALEIDTIGASLAWLGMIAYTLQIYYDFSGYSDMAIGLGRMLGFTFKENFNYPYTSTSIQEFWRRWHISLSSWFREYVYIPLGGSKCPRWKLFRNIFVVFLLTGIWHGANFTFWIWGLMYAVLLIIERAFLGDILKNSKHKLINWIYTMMFVMIGWVFFRSNSVAEAGMFIKNLFIKGQSEYTIASFMSMRVIIVLVASVLFSGFFQGFFIGVYKKIKSNFLVNFIDVLIQGALLLYSIMRIVGGTYNPFIYFQF